MSDTDFTLTTIPNNAFYYGDTFQSRNNFFCVPYAFDIAIENFIAENFFNNDLTRIIYSPEELAFRNRTRNQNVDDSVTALNLPFFHYYLSEIKDSTDHRMLFNNQANVQGINLGITDSLGIKLKTAPATLVYDCSFIFSQPKDKIYASSLLTKISSNENILYADVEASNVLDPTDTNTNIIRNPGFVYFDIDTSPNLVEDEWLQKNKIIIIKVGISIETVLFFTNTSGFGITKEIITNFLVSKDLSNKKDLTKDEGISILVDYLG